MSVVIDTSDVAVLEVSEFEPQEVETESIHEPETQPELSEVDPPSDPPIAKAIQVDDGDDFKARIWNAEMRCRGKEAIVEDLKEQLKFAKADYEDSVAALRKLATEGSSSQLSIPFETIQTTEIAETVEPLEASQEAGAAIDESWRRHSLIDMLKSSKISGLGDKKIEALAEICQTFGDFEDLRTKASLEFKHLKDVLPEGFGEKITDQIEEAYFEAVKNISLSSSSAQDVVPDSVNLADL